MAANHPGARLTRYVAALAACLMLGACAGRPAGLMRPVTATAPGATTIPLLVATTRRPSSEDDGALFTSERQSALSFAAVDVSIPPGHKIGEIEWPHQFPGDPARDFVTRRADNLPFADFAAALRDRVTGMKGRQVLVFVHGYNTKFDEAVYRFAQIVHDAKALVIPVLFTWPSRGKLLEYPHDRESATFSRDGLETVIRGLAGDPTVAEISILAHSMGNWVTLEALRQMAIRDKALPKKLKNLMLAAPDVDIDVAGTQARELARYLPKVTLFVSRRDVALAASRKFWGSDVQLGAIDPNQEPFRSGLRRFNVTAVDLTEVKTEDKLHHGTFAESPDVVRLIGDRLTAGQEIGERPGAGEQIGATVSGLTAAAGTIAGTAISAPLSIIDPSARETFGEAVSHLAPPPGHAEDFGTPPTLPRPDQRRPR